MAQLPYPLSVAAILLLLTHGCGCASAQGGKTARETKSVYREVRPDGTVIIDDSRNAGDVQQGSGIGLFSTPKIGETKGDELGAISFAGMKTGIANVMLGLGLFAAAFVLWKLLHQPLYGAGAFALGIAAFLVPTWLGIAALLSAFGVVVYLLWRPIVQLVRGVDKVIVKSNGAGEQIKETLATEQDVSTKAVVKAVKGG